jgi:hypothetical protein
MAEKPVTAEAIEELLHFVAYLIAEKGRVEYGPLLERLERELILYKEARDPVSRARAILADHRSKSSS